MIIKEKIELHFDSPKHCEQIRAEYERKGYKTVSYGVNDNTWFFICEIHTVSGR